MLWVREVSAQLSVADMTGFIFAVGSLVTLGLELWGWWQEQNDASTAHPFHEAS
jgi:hypothetical protein